MARGKGSVLSRQKPKRAGKSKRKAARGDTWRKLRWPLLGLLGAGLVYIAATNVSRQWSRLTASSGKPIDWKVDVRLDSDNPLPGRKAEDVARLAKESLGRGEPRELRRVANALQRLDGFATVHVLRVASDRVIVSLKPRIPVMCAELDRLRLVSDAGDVYGQAGVEGAPSCPGPRLVGLIANERKAAADQTVSLDDEDRTTVREAIELVNEGQSRGFTFTTIETRRYRGLSAQISGLETEVTLGRAPYADKLTRLRTLVDKLTAKGEVASRIELDYQGKAFVKLKKM